MNVFCLLLLKLMQLIVRKYLPKFYRQHLFTIIILHVHLFKVKSIVNIYLLFLHLTEYHDTFIIKLTGRMIMENITNQLLAQQFMKFMTVLYSTTKYSNPSPACLKAYSRGFYVLFALKYHPNPNFSMTQLADELQMSKQQLTKLVHVLEEKQLVHKKVDPNNRRCTILSLTEQGDLLLADTINKMTQDLIPELDIYEQDEKEQLFNCIMTLEHLLQLAQDRKQKSDSN